MTTNAKCFNGINITQTSTYNKLSVETYIEKLIHNHGWTNETTKATYNTPMKYTKDYIKDFDNA